MYTVCRCRASTLIARIAEEINLEVRYIFFRNENISSYLVWTPRTGRNLACRFSVCSFGGLRSDRKVESSTVKGTWTVGIRIFWNSDLIHWPGLGRDHRNLAVRCATARKWQLINIKPSLYLFHSYYLLRRYEGTKVPAAHKYQVFWIASNCEHPRGENFQICPPGCENFQITRHS